MQGIKSRSEEAGSPSSLPGNHKPGTRVSSKQINRSSPNTATLRQESTPPTSNHSKTTKVTREKKSTKKKKEELARKRETMPCRIVTKSPDASAGVRKSSRAREPRKYHPNEKFAPALNPKKRKAARISIAAPARNLASRTSVCGASVPPKASIVLADPTEIQKSSERKDHKNNNCKEVIVDSNDESLIKGPTSTATKQSMGSPRRRLHRSLRVVLEFNDEEYAQAAGAFATEVDSAKLHP